MSFQHALHLPGQGRGGRRASLGKVADLNFEPRARLQSRLPSGQLTLCLHQHSNKYQNPCLKGLPMVTHWTVSTLISALLELTAQCLEKKHPNTKHCMQYLLDSVECTYVAYLTLSSTPQLGLYCDSRRTLVWLIQHVFQSR